MVAFAQSKAQKSDKASVVALRENYAHFFTEYHEGAAEHSNCDSRAFFFVLFPPSTITPNSALVQETMHLSRHPSRAPMTDAKRYARAAAKTLTCIPCKSIAYPDLHGCYPNLPQQLLKPFPNALRLANCAKKCTFVHIAATQWLQE